MGLALFLLSHVAFLAEVDRLSDVSFMIGREAVEMRIRDLDRFRITPAAVEFHDRLAVKELYEGNTFEEILTWQGPGAADLWKFEQGLRREAWSSLSRAFDQYRYMTYFQVEKESEVTYPDGTAEKTKYMTWDSRPESAEEHVRRRLGYLDRLRNIIGDDNLYYGAMPESWCNVKR